MNIEWTRVTWYSQIIAIALFVGVFVLGMYLGMHVESEKIAAMQPAVAPVPSGTSSTVGTAATSTDGVIATATYKCDAGKEIQASYQQNDVQLSFSDGRSMTLPHAMSADGARYANANESIVFWNVGQTAFVTEGSSTTFANCKQIAAPVNQ